MDVLNTLLHLVQIACVQRAIASKCDVIRVQSMRAERELDLELLDSVTWPDYVWEWLRYMGGQPALVAAVTAPFSTAVQACSQLHCDQR